MTKRELLIIAIAIAVVGIVLGFEVGHQCAPSSAVVDAGPSAKVVEQAAAQNDVAVKQAVTKRRSDVRRVTQEVQREVTTSDLADYLGAHATVGSAPLGSGVDSGARDQGDADPNLSHRARDHPDPLAPGAP